MQQFLLAYLFIAPIAQIHTIKGKQLTHVSLKVPRPRKIYLSQKHWELTIESKQLPVIVGHQVAHFLERLVITKPRHVFVI